MMSNCAFWSSSGEMLAVHGSAAPDPMASFGPWASAQKLPSGRLVEVFTSFLPEAAQAGWQLVSPSTRRKIRACDPAVPVATPRPALDEAAARLFPPRVEHEKFTLRSWPTWIATAQLERNEGPEGWFAGLDEAKSNRFLVRLLPHRGRLPGEGWRNMLAWALRSQGVRLVPLNGLPRPEVLAAIPAWQYRVEAGRGPEAAAWDVQILPSRQLLLEWAPGTQPWEATALLRLVRPAAKPTLQTLTSEPQGEPRWAELFGLWSAADARLVVQNVLTTQAGGAAASAALFFDALPLPPGPDGRVLVRYVPQEGLPVALLSTLFGRRAWNEIERAKRFLPSESELKTIRSVALADLDLRVTEGRLLWSEEAGLLWSELYRRPLERDREALLLSIRRSGRWAEVLAAEARLPESLLRSLDVTDAALCLRDAPDARWRRFVTARREAELKQELEFCRVWDARGELSTERQLEAWRAWDELVAAFPLSGSKG